VDDQYIQSQEMTMRKYALLSLCLAALTLGAPHAYSANMAFMADQAMSRFTDQDAEIFNKAASQAFAAKDGTSIDWKNPATGAFGKLTPYPDPDKNPDCRVIRMENVAENVKSGGYYRFCKRADGSWPPVMPPHK
jgi:surface antigen